jgi:hypothetical protein
VAGPGAILGKYLYIFIYVYTCIYIYIYIYIYICIHVYICVILGVLPAVEMQSWRASTCYLGSFIVSSTLSMGTFAAVYGEATKRIGSTAVLVELILRVFSSCLSIVVGALWLILSLLGKLEGLFH